MPKMTAIRKSVQKASAVPSRVLQRQGKPAVPLHPVLRLQQTAGNQAVGQLIQAKQTEFSNRALSSNLHITASPLPPQGSTPTPSGGSPTPHPHPFTAVALEARMATERCRVPRGHHGVSKVLRYRIVDFNGRGVRRDLAVSERFTRLEGPEAVFRRLTPNLKRAEGGLFNDCYRLFQPEPFPGDFRLKVEQNHLLGSEVISKNHITYTPRSILVCVFRRPARATDFGSRCRNY